MIAIVLATALATAPASRAYRIDLGRYFASPAKEQSARGELMKRVTAFEKTPASSLRDPDSLLAWLNTYDGLVKALQRHDIYVYVRAEEDVSDHTDARADSALGEAMTRTDGAVRHMLARIGAKTLDAEMERNAALARFRFFIKTSLALSAH